MPIIAPGTIASFDKYALGENVIAGNGHGAARRLRLRHPAPYNARGMVPVVRRWYAIETALRANRRDIAEEWVQELRTFAQGSDATGIGLGGNYNETVSYLSPTDSISETGRPGPTHGPIILTLCDPRRDVSSGGRKGWLGRRRHRRLAGMGPGRVRNKCAASCAFTNVELEGTTPADKSRHA